MATRIVKFEVETLSLIHRLYLGDPCQHTYLYHDVFVDPLFTGVYLVLEGARIAGYLLIYSPPEARIMNEAWSVVWGDIEGAENLLPLSHSLIIQAYTNPKAINTIHKILSSHGEVSIMEFLDMEANTKEPEEATGPRLAEGLEVRRLTVNDAGMLSEVYRSVGWLRRAQTVKPRIQRTSIYGLFVEGILASTVAVCARGPRSWMLCSIATHPAFQGRGYAKNLLEYVHWLAGQSGISKLCLQVEKTNKKAISLYKKLGYRVVRSAKWLVYRPRTTALRL